jgi:hypothetical protein
VIYITIFRPEDPEITETSCLILLIYYSSCCGLFIVNIIVHNTHGMIQYKVMKTDFENEMAGTTSGSRRNGCFDISGAELSVAVQSGTFKTQP